MAEQQTCVLWNWVQPHSSLDCVYYFGLIQQIYQVMIKQKLKSLEEKMFKNICHFDINIKDSV